MALAEESYSPAEQRSRDLLRLYETLNLTMLWVITESVKSIGTSHLCFNWPVSSGSSLKVVSHLWNQLQISGVVTRTVVQGCHRASTSAQYHYLALCVRQHRRIMAPWLARALAAVSGRRISCRAVTAFSCRDWPLRMATSLVRLFDCIQQGKMVIVELNTSDVDTTRMGACSFQ
ncbi:hypothetical protein TNCV_3133201 [Trichonephila clavipes]|nr:hypothetical protein TNCV_3133201 [Trichonephila clavipes]